MPSYAISYAIYDVARCFELHFDVMMLDVKGLKVQRSATACWCALLL